MVDKGKNGIMEGYVVSGFSSVAHEAIDLEKFEGGTDWELEAEGGEEAG